MARQTRYFPLVLCSMAMMAGCQDSRAGRDAATLPAVQTTAESALNCDHIDQALESMKSDSLFQNPYVDKDEWRDDPVRHRYVHGGFAGTETRFSLYLPPEEQYDGRFFQYITPVPMNEYLSQGATGEEDKIGFAIDSGAYFIETNGGGRGAMGQDATIGAYRANAAVAQYSRVIAMEMYGCERPYGYPFGGSGGGYRTIGGMENTQGVWDGAVPFVIGSPMAMPNGFTVRMYALRVLKDKLPAIADAVEVGSNVEVADLLTDDEYAVFQEVTKMGFPMEAWYVHDKLDLHGYASLFPGVVAADPTYFTEDFWSLPGYEGYNPPQSLLNALIEHHTAIKNLVFTENAEQSGLRQSLLGDESRGLADDAWKSVIQSRSPGVPVAIQLENMPDKNLLGADLIIATGAAAGSRILITRFGDDFILVGSQDETVLSKLEEGDEVVIDNRNFLASQTYHRHQVPEGGYPVYDQFRDEAGKPIYPQRSFLLGPMMTQNAAGSVPSGQFDGKMIVLANLHDTEAYPWQGDWYLQAAKSHLGDDLNDRLRLWYTDRSPHGDVSELSSPTQMVSYLGVLQQALRDVSAWVEKGIEPPSTSRYRVVDGQVELPPTADERAGIQPVIQLRANGQERAEIRVGEPVELTAAIEVPEGSGKIVQAAWDFEGEGSFSDVVEFDRDAGNVVMLRASYSYDVPGTYFVTLKVASQRQGDTSTPYALIRNLSRVRIVVN